MNPLSLYFTVLLMTVSQLSSAAEKTDPKKKKNHRKAAAHVHGSSELNIVASANEFSVTGSLPMDDIAGFERAPHNETESAAIKSAFDLIKAGKLVGPENADCKITDPKVFVDPTFDKSISHYEIDIDLSWSCQSPVKNITVEGFNTFKNINALKFLVLDQGKQTSLSLKRSDQKTLVPLSKK
ncbi:MAG: DUF2796 domain-containing protein [Pseudomonadota bacterium]